MYLFEPVKIARRRKHAPERSIGLSYLTNEVTLVILIIIAIVKYKQVIVRKQITYFKLNTVTKTLDLLLIRLSSR